MDSWRDSYIVDFLKTENARLSCGGRWLVFDNDEWVVYEHQPYARQAIVLYREQYLSQKALDILAGKEE